MTKALWIDLLREIKKNKMRFLSLFSIVVLGVAFFTGVRASEPDMKQSVDTYYDKQQFMDIRVLCTYGMTDADIADIRMLKGVSFAAGTKTGDAMCVTDDTEMILKLQSYVDGINEPYIIEGRAPREADECLIDTAMARNMGLEIGDEISLTSGKKNTDISEMLTFDTYRIVGIGDYPSYLTYSRGSNSLGDGQTDYFLLLSVQAFVSEVYTEVYVLLDGSQELLSSSEAYEELVDTVADRIASLQAQACARRMEEVYLQALGELHDSEEFLEAWEEAHTEALEQAKQTAYDTAYQMAWKQAYEVALQTAYEEAYQEGLKQAMETAYEEAYPEAYETAYQEALEQAKQQAYAIGEAQAKEKAYEIALKQTKEEALAQAIEEAYQEAYAQGYAAFRQQAYETGYAQAEEEMNVMLTGMATALEQVSSQSYDTALQVIQGLLEAGLEDQELAGEILRQVEEYLNQQGGSFDKEAFMQSMTETISPLLKQYYDENFEKEFSTGIYPTLFELQFDKIFQTEYKPLVEAEFEAVWQRDYQAQFDAGFENAWKTEYRLQFEKEFESIWQKEYQATFDEEFEKGFESQFAEELEKRFQEEYQEEFDAEFERQWQETYQAQFDAEFQKNFTEEFDAGFADEFDTLWEQEYAEKFEETFAKEFLQEFDANAMEQLAEELDKPEWYILDRNSIQTYVEYQMDAERIGKIGNVFPLLFFLVAALVSLTTMTRMVEEQRGQIGTLKALGYSGISICGKYIIYALFATVGGSAVGTLIGEKLFPWVILTAYHILYNGIHAMTLPYRWGIALVATTAACACILGGCLAVCVRTTSGRPAMLMRPAAPKSGKRIWLEYIRPLWHFMTFTQKASARNLFRYKKRLIMTVFGIGSCMGLLLVGFGLRDSILAIAKYQFSEIFTYAASVTLNMEAETEDQQALLDFVQEYEGIEDQLLLHTEYIDVNTEKATKNVTLFIPQNTTDIPDYFVMRDRETKEQISYPTEIGTVALSEKLAKVLGVSVGDTVLLKPDETVAYEVTVASVFENYIYHYVCMSSDTYESIFGTSPEYQTLWLRTATGEETFEQQLCTDILEHEACGSIALISTTQNSLDDMLSNLNLIVWVLILSAGTLAFVVLYNLNNINITERERELATIKVLGFFDNEVASYVYRDSFALTGMGCVFGLFFGKLLHMYVIETVEVDIMMFGRSILLPSFAYSILLTVLFSVLVNLFMYFRLQKIDMVQSLKSVE